MTYYVLGAYVALVTAPELITKYANIARCACVVFAFLTALPASLHLRNLRKQHDRQIDRQLAAAEELPLVRTLLGEPPRRPGRSYRVLIAAVIVGALLVISINVSRIVTS